MPLFLKKRNENLTEKMDQPDCNKELLFNTYQQFTMINRLISGWQKIYRTFIYTAFYGKPGPFSILDIGCGGGDVIRLLDSLTKKDGFEVRFTGIDPDARAVQYLSGQNWPENISFLKATSSELVQNEHIFDVVISNHLVHHLTQLELAGVCRDAEQLASRRVIFNDIERSDIGYACFKLAASPVFHNSFIVPDGLTSIKRSFRKKELQEALPDGWEVHRQLPFRLLAAYEVASQ